jgi:hypothetical protein
VNSLVTSPVAHEDLSSDLGSSLVSVSRQLFWRAELRGFYHPGVLVNRAQLELIRAKVRLALSRGRARVKPPKRANMAR